MRGERNGKRKVFKKVTSLSLSKYIYLYIYLSQENIKNGPNWNFKTFMQKPCVIKNNVFDAENLNFFLFSEVKVKVFYP